jgi:CO/xanthine dehydrogenase FAD-binding subunit
MRPFAFYAPNSLPEALTLLQQQGQGGRLLAGGTDLLVQMKERDLAPRYVVSLRNLPELRTISFDPSGGLTVGARVSMRAIELDPDIRAHYAALAEAAGVVGSIQVRNLATLGGNICNAAPSADTAPALIALAATAVIAGTDVTREVPVEELFQGPGRTALQPGEILVAITCAPPRPRSGSAYLRHTPRAELDIAVVGASAALRLDGETIADARVALGAVAPVPLRLPAVEAALKGQPATAATLATAAEVAEGEVRPISDQRGSEKFRRTLSAVLTRRVLERALAAAQAGEA